MTDELKLGLTVIVLTIQAGLWYTWQRTGDTIIFWLEGVIEPNSHRRKRKRKPKPKRKNERL
ncbi:MAG: hypothetical protein JXQ72_04600 [Anaerolineae bacterium]|nr:hypothetical protein [Anaerolineae bacterium]